MSENPPTVFIVDDDPSSCAFLSLLVNSIGLRAEAFASAEEFLSNARPDGPGCLVLDVQMPGLSGLDLQRELARTDFQLPIIFITGYGDIPMSVHAIKSGAVGFLTKPIRVQELLDNIREAINRDRMARERQNEIATLRMRLESLTPREHEVFVLVVQGLLNKQIAADLGVSERTIKAHRGEVMRKMQADSLAELVRIAERLEISSS